MKKLLLAVLLAVSVGFIGCAKEAEARGNRNFKKYVNEESKPRMEAGIGSDIKLWDHEKFIIDQETRMDLNSGDGTWEKSNIGTYTVLKPKMEKGLFQIIGDKITSLFKKDVVE